MRVKIGSDDFCSNCMEWQEYDEEGRCKKCGKIIMKQKINDKKESYAEYERESVNFEESEDE